MNRKSIRHLITLLSIVATVVLGGCAMPAAYPQTAAPAGEPAASDPEWYAEAPAAEESAADSADDWGYAAEAAEEAESAPAGDEHAAPSSEYESHRAPRPAPAYDQQQYEPVTAGVVDDNEQWRDYLDYRQRHSYLWVRDRDVSERITIQVWDDQGQPVHDAIVEIADAGEQILFIGRTDAGGRVLFHPRALDRRQWGQDRYDVTVRKGYVAQRAQMDAYQSSDQWDFVLTDPPRADDTQLDLLFLIDATGSMGDEIDKLKRSMAAIADQIDALPERPYVRYGLVAYRDRGDLFVVRTWEFTDDLRQFQSTLARLRADGGGDTPEALNEALHRSIHQMNWNRQDTVRIVLLVADAPPHLDYQEPFSYDTDMIEAVARGIKIFPVGASGLDEQGEYIFRQLAQFTGGKFVFLTYEDEDDPSSGPGTETGHDVDEYSVDTLDRLIVRLVREELAKLPPVNRQQ